MNSTAAALVWHPVLDRVDVGGFGSGVWLGDDSGVFCLWRMADREFSGAEMREREELAAALVDRSVGVVALYVGVTFAYLAVLGRRGWLGLLRRLRT